jgi:hypothetical protein
LADIGADVENNVDLVCSECIRDIVPEIKAPRQHSIDVSIGETFDQRHERILESHEHVELDVMRSVS